MQLLAKVTVSIFGAKIKESTFASANVSIILDSLMAAITSRMPKAVAGFMVASSCFFPFHIPENLKLMIGTNFMITPSCYFLLSHSGNRARKTKCKHGSTDCD